MAGFFLLVENRRLPSARSPFSLGTLLHLLYESASAKTRAPGIFPQFRRHPLLGSSRLVINWGAIPQGGMQPPVIVIAKIASQREPQLPLGPEPRAVHHLGLQRVKERLHVRIVARGPHSGRALPDAQSPEPVPERLGRVLATAIAVEDEPGPWAPAADGRVQHRTR